MENYAPLYGYYELPENGANDIWQGEGANNAPIFRQRMEWWINQDYDQPVVGTDSLYGKSLKLAYKKVCQRLNYNQNSRRDSVIGHLLAVHDMIHDHTGPLSTVSTNESEWSEVLQASPSYHSFLDHENIRGQYIVFFFIFIFGRRPLPYREEQEEAAEQEVQAIHEAIHSIRTGRQNRGRNIEWYRDGREPPPRHPREDEHVANREKRQRNLFLREFINVGVAEYVRHLHNPRVHRFQLAEREEGYFNTLIEQFERYRNDPSRDLTLYDTMTWRAILALAKAMGVSTKKTTIRPSLPEENENAPINPYHRPNENIEEEDAVIDYENAPDEHGELVPNRIEEVRNVAPDPLLNGLRQARGNTIYMARERMNLDPANIIPAPEGQNPNMRVTRSTTRQTRGRNLVGVLDEGMRKRINTPAGGVLDYYYKTKALRLTPNREISCCLLMSIMRSELRVYDLLEGTIEELKASSTPSLLIYPSIHIDWETEGEPAPTRNYSFWNVYEGKICLFNNFKRKQNGEFYEVICSDEELEAWEWCAKRLHEWCCRKVGFWFAYDDETCLEYYATLLNVDITVYSPEMKGQRRMVYDGHREDDLRFQVINLLIHENHSAGITHLRSFLKNEKTKNSFGVYNYCVFCEKKYTTNNMTRTKFVEHLKECGKKNNYLLKMNEIEKFNQLKLKKQTFIPIERDPSNNTQRCTTCKKWVANSPFQLKQIHQHQCTIPPPKGGMEKGDPKTLYAYDFECCQFKIPFEGMDIFEHQVNKVCVRSVYDSSDRQEFDCIEDFMQYVLAQQEPRKYIAHNGGRYDVQFVLRYLEKTLTTHTFIPTPSSMHSFLSVSTGKAVFLDFRNYMSGSLSNIAKAFHLKQAKGDFPHMFNNGEPEHNTYLGCIPDFDETHLHVARDRKGLVDYWGILTKRSQGEVEKLYEWWKEENLKYCHCHSTSYFLKHPPTALHCSTCSLPYWNFQEHLSSYCWVDVDVLSEAICKYREASLAFKPSEDLAGGWKPEGLDPFEYLTIPQMGFQIFLNGYNPVNVLPMLHIPKRVDRNPKALKWLLEEQEKTPYLIHHAGNSLKEVFDSHTGWYLDGYIYETNTAYICLDCEFHACGTCYAEECADEATMHPRGLTYHQVNKRTKEILHLFQSQHKYTNVIITPSHNIHCDLYENQMGKLMTDREMFYGGRTEVFSSYVNMEHSDFVEKQLKYVDFCSEYPSVCAYKELPVGIPIHVVGKDIDISRLTTPNRELMYFGFMRVKIKPPKDDRIGFLPYRNANGRLEFPLKTMTGSWGTEELRLAVSCGYEILEVYELYHWDTTQRSDKLFRGYIGFFLRMKMESEGWKKLGASSDSPDEEEKDRLVQKLYKECEQLVYIRKEHVEVNPVNRAIGKMYLNSLWGKLCQKPRMEEYVTLYGLQQFISIYYDPEVEKKNLNFRQLDGDVWKVKYSFKDNVSRVNPRYNIFIAAKVTEWARTDLHRQMLKYGKENVHYCDTDSLMITIPKQVEFKENGLGKLVDEYPGKVLKALYALAPKFYQLDFEDPSQYLLKLKGVSLNRENAYRVTRSRLKKMILGGMLKIPANIPFTTKVGALNMQIGINTTSPLLPYGKMYTKMIKDKMVGMVISKRKLLCLPSALLAQMSVQQKIEILEDEAMVEKLLSLVSVVHTVPLGIYYCREIGEELCYKEMTEFLYNKLA